jgi:hypothetical protein
MTGECSVPGCTSAARSKGLCSKHYMRTRRHGDPNIIGKGGRPPNPDLARIREKFPDLSGRTQARYARALKINRLAKGEFGIDEVLQKAKADAVRPRARRVQRIGSADASALPRQQRDDPAPDQPDD